MARIEKIVNGLWAQRSTNSAAAPIDTAPRLCSTFSKFRRCDDDNEPLAIGTATPIPTDSPCPGPYPRTESDSTRSKSKIAPFGSSAR